jgi:hypothetical protein
MESYLEAITDLLTSIAAPSLLSWIAAIGSSLTLLVVCFYIFQYINNNRRHKYEKAIEYANIYANEVLPQMGYIYELYDSANVEDILHKVRNAKLSDFDYTEYDAILTANEKRNFENAFRNLDLNKYVQAHEKHFQNPYPYCITSLDLENIPEYIEPAKNVEKMLIQMYSFEYDKLCEHILNTLETIAMGYILKVANEKVVYCSLHQSFIKTAEILYLKIAPKNIKPEDKLYSYIARLYREWKTRSEDSKTQKAKLSEKLGFLGKPLQG